MTPVVVRAVRPEDAEQVLAIYRAGLDAGFEHPAPDWAAFDADTLPDHRFVAVDTCPPGPSKPGVSANASAARSPNNAARTSTGAESPACKE